MTSKEFAKARHLLLQYGAMPEQREAVLAYQEGTCYGCRRPPKKNALGTDHRHSDGLFRGFLCMDCNKALAYLRDDATRADRLAQYLRVPPAVRCLGFEIHGRVGRATRKWKAKEKREALLKYAEQLKMLQRSVVRPPRVKAS